MVENQQRKSSATHKKRDNDKTGYESVETAKQNGSWIILDEVEELIIPNDLEKAFEKHKGSKDFYLSLSKSVRKMMLGWIFLAKRPETRQKAEQ